MLLVATVARFFACWYWSDDLTRDPDAYQGLAVRLHAGEGFVSPNGEPTAFRPPLYPILLSATVEAGAVGLAILQIVLGVGTVALTYALGKWLGLGRFALLAAAIVAVDPLLLRYTPQAMTETTCAFLAVLLISVLAIQQQLTRPSELATGRTRWIIASLGLGLVMGLAVLTRPTFWAVIVLITADACLRILFRYWHNSPTRNTGKTSGTPSPSLPLPPSPPPSFAAPLILAGLLAIVAPWAARNAVVFGEPKITTTHGGYTLLLANNPVFWNEVVLGPPRTAWSGKSLAAWQAMLERELRQAGIAPTDEFARDRWMRNRAISHIREHPGLFLRASLYRLRRFWGVMPIGPSATSMPTIVRWSIGLFYGLVFTLALLGLIFLLKPGGGEGEGGRGVDYKTRNRKPESRGIAAWWRDKFSATVDTPPTQRRAAQPLPPSPLLPLSPSHQLRHALPPTERAAPSAWRALLWLILGFTLVHAVYWTDTRMRAPIVPALAILAARGLRDLPKIPRAQSQRKSS